MSKPPSWNEIRANAAAFVARWDGETQENAEAQTFWNEFLAMFGVDRRRVATFEQRAKRTSTGGRGRIDLFWPGTLAAEHKSAGKSLADAERQALDYLDALEDVTLPEYIVASDFANVRLLHLTSGEQAVEFPLKDLVKEIDRFGFVAGYTQRTFTSQQEEQANIQAARLMGRLYEQLAGAGYEGHDASVLMTRLLFLLFGDDTGMWEKGLFAEFIESRTNPDGSDLGAQLANLFQNLDKQTRSQHLDELIARFPYVNGGLFRDRLDIPAFDREMRDELLACNNFDWSLISPAIFGSMFQSVKSKEARREMGEHYTTEQNILKVIGPLFLDDLRAEFERGYNSSIVLKRLRARLGTLRYMDPACGCGNFLVVAYREMRGLELAIMKRLAEVTGESQLSLDATLGLQVSLDQFYGIEIEEWPARIAETAMFLVDHQANKAMEMLFGQAPQRLPIEIAATIHLGNAAETDWSSLLPASDNVYVFGNPPFVGMSWMSQAQQDDNRRAFSKVNQGALRTGRLDYVAVWYALAMDYLRGTRGRAAFVSTNSITQGEQARSLDPLLRQNGFVIDFAHRTFKWTSEAPKAAAVHVVIIGFSEGGQATRKRLFDYPSLVSDPDEVKAAHITAWLVDHTGVMPSKRSAPLVPSLPAATTGSKPWDGGSLIIEPGDYDEFANDPAVGPYIRPYRGARELLNGIDRWCLWLADAPPQVLRSPLLKERLANVAALRAGSPTPRAREASKTPGHFAEIRQPATSYIALPQTSSENRDYLPGVVLGPEVVVSNGVLIWTPAELWVFGYLQSRAFMAWVKAFTGRMKSDLQIAPGLVYFTFPFVVPDQATKTKIEAAVQEVIQARDRHPGASLADLYDPLATPKNLLAAHATLDGLIDGLYGLRRPTEGQRLQALLNQYDRLSAPLIHSQTTVKKWERAGNAIEENGNADDA